jgi:hypothetical protein
MAREPLVIEFDEAVEIAGKTYEKVTMRVPKGKDLKRVTHIADVYSRDCTMISNLCDLNASVEDFDEIEVLYINQLQAGLRSFLLPKVN